MSNQFTNLGQSKPNQELIKMVYEFDEWSPGMLEAVEEELEKRKILPDNIAIRKQEAILAEDALLSRGKAASLAGQVFGWIFVLGFIGFFIAYNYRYTKVTSKFTGKKYFKYDEASREVGSYMFYTFLVVAILGFIYAVATFDQ